VQALWPLIRQVEQEVVTPEFVADELTAAGLVAASAAVLRKLLDASGLGGAARPRLKLLLLGASLAGYGLRLVLRVARRTVEVRAGWCVCRGWAGVGWGGRGGGCWPGLGPWWEAAQPHLGQPRRRRRRHLRRGRPGGVCVVLTWSAGPHARARLQVVRAQASARRRLLGEWRTVLDRIDIMTALVEGPELLEPRAQAAVAQAAWRSGAAPAAALQALPAADAAARGGAQHQPPQPPAQRQPPEQLHPSYSLQCAASWDPGDAEPSAPAMPA
jgi:hypothetical protein